MKHILYLWIVAALAAAEYNQVSAVELRNILVRRQDNTLWKSDDAGKTWVQQQERAESAAPAVLTATGLKLAWANEYVGSGWGISPQASGNVYITTQFNQTPGSAVTHCVQRDGQRKWRSVTGDTMTYIVSTQEKDNAVLLGGAIGLTASVPPLAYGMYIRSVSATDGTVTDIKDYRKTDSCIFLGSAPFIFQQQDGSVIGFWIIRQVTKKCFLMMTKASPSMSLEFSKKLRTIEDTNVADADIRSVVRLPSGEYCIFGQTKRGIYVGDYFLYKFSDRGELLASHEWREQAKGLPNNKMILLPNGNLAIVTSSLVNPEYHYPTATVFVFTPDITLLKTIAITGKKYFHAFDIAPLNATTFAVCGGTAPEYTAKPWALDGAWDYGVVTVDLEGNQKLDSWGAPTIYEHYIFISGVGDGRVYTGWQPDDSFFKVQAFDLEATGVAETDGQLQMCAPNPSNGSFSVRAEEGSTIRVVSMLGTTVETGVCTSGVWRSFAPLYSAGLYLVEITGLSGKTTYRKAMVAQ